MKHRGFTLIELMVVVFIIGILAALAIPRFFSSTAKAKLAEIKSGLQDIYVLEEVYYHANGKYSADSTAVGYVPPRNKSYFDYKLLPSPTVLGHVQVQRNMALRLSDGSQLKNQSVVACVDTSGLQFANQNLPNSGAIAIDAGLQTSAGDPALLPCP